MGSSRRLEVLGTRQMNRRLETMVRGRSQLQRFTELNFGVDMEAGGGKAFSPALSPGGIVGEAFRQGFRKTRRFSPTRNSRQHAVQRFESFGRYCVRCDGA